MLQREASARTGQASQSQTVQQQPKWPPGGANATTVSSEQLSLELHQVEREIGKRTREMALVRNSVYFKYECLNSQRIIAQVVSLLS